MADCRRAVANCVGEHLDDTPHQRVLIATSGGSDSLALAWAAAFVLPRHGHFGEAVIIDHQLQDNSAEVAAAAKARLIDMGLDVTILPVSVDGTGNVEENARTARYQALENCAAAHGATAILLGHTEDDQAETVLLGLTRGSGPTSIRGMSTKRGLWLRPFLGVSAKTTEQACLDAGIDWWEDPHNTDPRFVRPRIRHDLLPVIEDTLGPGISKALAHTAKLVGDDDDYLNELAASWLAALDTDSGALPTSALAKLARPLRTRIVRGWVKARLGVSMSFHQTDMVDALIADWEGQGPVSVAGSRLGRRNGHLVIDPPPHNTEE